MVANAHSQVTTQPAAESFNLILHSHCSKQRQQLQAYIAEQYRRIYDAEVRDFSPLLLNLNHNLNTQAALGLKPGYCGSLFLEHYLDQPVEQVIASHARTPVSRDSVMEIGNLVSTSRGGSLPLFLMMAGALQEAGYQWMVFTATPQVEKLVRRLQVELQVLANADQSKINGGTAHWGSYYNRNPKVLLGNINSALAAAKQRPELQQFYIEHSVQISALAQRLRDHKRFQKHNTNTAIASVPSTLNLIPVDSYMPIRASL